ncbi:hypothetical protein JCM10207_005809 [Rhodosporidiobolus poonsookiae]
MTPSVSSMASADPEKGKLEGASSVAVLPAASRTGTLMASGSNQHGGLSSYLPDVKEEEEDEGAAVAGFERHSYTEEEEKAVKRKLDRRVIPILAAVYFSQFFDKNSLTYSSVMGLPIKGQHYNLIASAFYVGFVIFEIPTSALAQRFPRAKYLGVNMMLWATFLILHAATANFPFFYVMRFFLGVFECCVSPILISYIASMYPKTQQAKRISCFYCMNGLTNMFGGLVAWAVTFYKGDGIAHWRIMYLIMGGLAFAVATWVLVALPDSLATADFLTEREKIVAFERVRDNQTGSRQKHIKWYQVREAITDPKTYILLLLTFLSSIPNGGLASFSSLLLKGFGYTSRETLLLQIPRGFIAACTTVTVCFLSDRFQRRMLPILISIIPTLIGAALMVGFSGGGSKSDNKSGSLAGIFMAETYGSALALQYAWTASNTGSSTKKSVVNGMFLVAFGLGNIAGTFIFQSRDAPSYTPGKIAVLVLFAIMVPTVLCMHFYTNYLNKQKDRKLAALIAEHGWTDEDVQRERDRAAFLDLTDRENVYHRYVN